MTNSRSPDHLQPTEKIAAAVFRCDLCYKSLIKAHTTARQRDRKSFKRKHAALYAHITSLTWKQLCQHRAEYHRRSTIPFNSPSAISTESVSMAESIIAKIEHMNPKPDAELARRIYEKWKAEQEQ